MALKFGLAIAMLGGLLAASPVSAQTQGDLTGVWQTQNGDARVRITRCGSRLCGNVIWLRDKLDPATGSPPVDNRNPDPSKQSRPIIGIQLFSDMHPVGESRWKGHIYNADDGGTYVSHLGQTGQDSLKVEGCVGALCGHEMWSRVGK